jgi:hypothetical protein
MGEAPEWVHTTLDVTGIIEPTPFSDGVNAGLYASEGRWGAAGISIAGAVVPYVGDLGKSGRLLGKVLSSRVATRSNWAKPGTLARHFKDHGADFGAKTAEEYAKKASDFLKRAQADKLPTKIDSSGTIRVYDPKTNTFGSYNPDGTTRTFFKPNPAEHGLPTNRDYWKQQKGREL